jgi:hypothetical protein
VVAGGGVERDGQGRQPETGPPQGGTVSPVLAPVSLHSAWALWCDTVVKAPCRGEALWGRYADAWGCACRSQDDAERGSRVRPQRRQQCNREVAPEHTHGRRLRRVPPSMQRRFTWLGGACAWRPERHEGARVRRRTTRQKLQAASQRLTAWSKYHRHLPERDCCPRLHARLRGHDSSYDVRGHARAPPLFALGHGLYGQVAPSAGRPAAPLHLGAVSPGPRPRQDSTLLEHSGQTSKRVCLQALLCTADARTTEEPEAGQLHVRGCTGGAA